MQAEPEIHLSPAERIEANGPPVRAPSTPSGYREWAAYCRRKAAEARREGAFARAVSEERTARQWDGLADKMEARR